jgi:putative flippase GtrA
MVGVVGYIVDAGILLLLVQLASLQPLPARIWSFVIAASVTFVFNQRFTFRMQESFSVQRWSFYLAATAFGAAINVGLYHAWIQRTDTTPSNLMLGTAVGSLVAMTVNYAVSSLLVFRFASRGSQA